jgi:hypothetical protein
VLSDILTHWQNETITIVRAATSSAFDSEGNPVQSTATTTYPAMIQQQIKTIGGRDGQIKVSNTQIFLAPTCPVTIDDTITLPDGSQPLILAIAKMPDFCSTELSYVEVFT